MSKIRFARDLRKSLDVMIVGLSALALVVAGCAKSTTPDDDKEVEAPNFTARISIEDPPMLNILETESCGEYRQELLQEPVEIHPVDGVLKTQLVVAMRKRCVPVFASDTGWTLQPLTLRTYGFPKDHSAALTAEQTEDLKSERLVWTAPGPTFVLNKATAPGLNNGTNFKMRLFNRLPVQDDPHRCNEMARAANAKGKGGVDPFRPNTEPNCFHGDNSTNFHFHGFHVSPQPGQDWVGLELLPFGSVMPRHAVHTRGEAAVGVFDFDVDRLRYTQAEGTHWYHAHKHGSTALQVLNGLVGTFKILGEFDKELASLFQSQGGLTDRLLVVQQIQERPPGYKDGSPRPTIPLINGMANPILEMRPGEIQRWRFVGATMQASASLEIGFPQVAGAEATSPQVRQIAMDGVQFAPQNYACQPMLYGPDCESGTEDDSFKALESMGLDPGTRIDLLVQAPQRAGRHTMTFRMAAELHETAAEDLEEKVTALVRMTNRAMPRNARAITNPPLLTVVVKGDPVDGRFPTEDEFPKLPGYLDDLEPPFETRTVAYEMNDKRGNLKEVEFFICGSKYDPSCVNETLTLDVAEEWTLTNNSSIAHPFHIHTNPFQLVSDDKGEYPAPYIWRDTVAIPTGKPEDLGQAVIRYVAKEFTGEFVNHCHILGHEDRGMMHNVQAVCPNGDYGKPTSDLSPECREGNYLPSAPKCTTGTCGNG